MSVLALCAAGLIAAMSTPPASAVVGGATAPSGSWPWLAYIADSSGSGSSCAGAVVASNVVLTAASCVEEVATGAIFDPASFTVTTGSLDRTAAAAQVSAVSRILVFPGASETAGRSGAANIVGDAALLVLATPTTAPAIAMAGSEDVEELVPGTVAEFAGWGLTSGASPAPAPPDAAQLAGTGVQSTQECVSGNTLFDATAQLCTLNYSSTAATSPCVGDVGAPLIVAEPTQLVVLGIASSWGAACNPKLPAYFTRVDYVSSWAQSEIAAVAPVTPPPPPPVGPTSATGPTSPATPPPATQTAPVSAPPAATPAAPIPAVLPAAPVPAAASPVAMTVPAPRAGAYRGRSSQRHGDVRLTVGARGVTDLQLRFNLRCRRRYRGPFFARDESPIAIRLTARTWAFSTVFRDNAGWLFSVKGAFSGDGAATGRLSVITFNRRCRTGNVAWRAAPATAAKRRR